MFESLSNRKTIKIIGCGLAGAEVAFILANNGFNVHIFDNGQNLPSKSFDYYDEYQTFLTENMLDELDLLNSPLLSLAKKYGYENFGFLYSYDFMKKVRSELENHPHIHIFDAEIDEINESEPTIIATGHNTSMGLVKTVEKLIGQLHMCFYQPQLVAIDEESLDKNKINFINQRDCFVNLTEREYRQVVSKILEFDKDYDKIDGEKQITIENMAQMSDLALRNSFFRPHFAQDKPYASLKMSYMIGQKVFLLDDFVSALSNEEQAEILNCIDALKGCKILRFSSVRRTTYLLAPSCLNQNMQLKANPNIFVCGGFAGTAGSFETLLMANYCAYNVICHFFRRYGVEFLAEKTCISKILQNLLEKSVVKFRLITLKYDIIKLEDLEVLKSEVENQRELSKSQIEKFKEKFYGNYF